MSIIPHCSFYQAHFLLTNMSLSTVLHTQIINHCTLNLTVENHFLVGNFLLGIVSRPRDDILKCVLGLLALVCFPNQQFL